MGVRNDYSGKQTQVSVHFQCLGLRSSCTECRMGGQVLLPSVSSDLLLLPGPRGKGGPKLSILIPKSPVPLPESHCPGDPTVEVCQPNLTQVYLLLWDISRHSLLTDNTLSKEQQTDPVPCRSEPQSQV